jgi:hypothetical protein
MKIYLFMILFCIAQFCYACDCFVAPSNQGVLTTNMIKYSNKIHGMKLFKAYDIYKYDFGSLIKKNDKVLLLNSILDSCELNCLNILLSKENLKLSGGKSLDLYVEELFHLDNRLFLLDPSSDHILPSLDSTTNDRLINAFNASGITFKDYLSYFKDAIFRDAKVYVVNSIEQNNAEYMIKPEIKLIFVLAEISHKTFAIRKISAKEAKEFMSEK